mmetsp:Transcript_88795/g.256101  ORF Transcript_88795/g.256101 Transcript_88795/m.256101 type:complete len:237 (+) Transcript_88795:1406-2116(+)
MSMCKRTVAWSPSFSSSVASFLPPMPSVAASRLVGSKAQRTRCIVGSPFPCVILAWRRTSMPSITIKFAASTVTFKSSWHCSFAVRLNTCTQSFTRGSSVGWRSSSFSPSMLSLWPVSGRFNNWESFPSANSSNFKRRSVQDLAGPVERTVQAGGSMKTTRPFFDATYCKCRESDKITAWCTPRSSSTEECHSTEMGTGEAAAQTLDSCCCTRSDTCLADEGGGWAKASSPGRTTC